MGTLHLADGRLVRDGDVEALRRALDATPDLAKSIDREGFTLLHVAADALELPVVELLLAHGADPNAPSLGQERPLDRALTPLIAWPRTTPLVAVVRGAVVRQEVRPPRRSEASRVPVVRALLRAGAEVNPPPIDPSRPHIQSWEPPLVAAARLGNVALVDLLLAHGARARGVRGRHAVEAAAARQDLAVLDALIARGARIRKSRAIAEAVRGCHQSISESRHTNDAFRIEQARAQVTIGHSIACGAPIARRLRGWTPLHYAVSACLGSVVKTLLAHGAPLNRRAKPPQRDDSEPLLVFAIRAAIVRKVPSTWMLPIVHTLVQAGADRRAVGSDGRSAWRIALDHGLVVLAVALL